MEDAPLGSSAAEPGPSPRRLRAWAFLAARVIATAALMGLLIRRIDWNSFLSLLERCDWKWWLAGFAMAMATTMLAAIRWAALSRPLGFRLPTATFVWRFLEGQFFSLFMPSSIGGDVVKAYRLAGTTAGRLLAACTVLADRLAGLAALGVLAGTAILAREWSLGTPAVLVLGAGLLLAAILAFRLGVNSIDWLLALIPEHHPARRVVAQLLPYRERPGLMARAIGWSLLVQAGGSVAVSFMALSLGISLPLATWFAVVPLVTLAITVPLTINGVGIREGGLSLLLKPAGVSPDAAVAIGLLWFISTNLVGLLGGLLFMIDRKPSGPSIDPGLPRAGGAD